MRKLSYFVVACFSLLPSCLKAGLDDLPSYDEAEILAFGFEYRWSVTEGTSDKMQVQALSTRTVISDGEVRCTVTVPAPSSAFSNEVWSGVGLGNLVGYCSISTAAKIAPVGKAPVLGGVGDFSQEVMVYKVTAADKKTVKEWRLVIEELKYD